MASVEIEAATESELNENIPEKEKVSPSATAFSNEVSTLVNHDEIAKLLQMQTEIYLSLKQSNQNLTSFNDFSAGLYSTLSKEYDKHTKMMKDMKRDLDYIFRKIRQLKSKIQSKYPDAFST